MSDLLALKTKKPYVGRFLEEWLNNYGNRKFDFSDQQDQEDFAEAVEKMAKHIIHTSPSGRISVIFSAETGIDNLFIHSE